MKSVSVVRLREARLFPCQLGVVCEIDVETAALGAWSVVDVREIEQRCTARRSEALPAVFDEIARRSPRRMRDVEVPDETPTHDVVNIAVDVLDAVDLPCRRAEVELCSRIFDLHAPLVAVGAQVEAEMARVVRQPVEGPAAPLRMRPHLGTRKLTDRNERAPVEEETLVLRGTSETRIARHRTPFDRRDAKAPAVSALAVATRRRAVVK